MLGNGRVKRINVFSRVYRGSIDDNMITEESKKGVLKCKYCGMYDYKCNFTFCGVHENCLIKKINGDYKK
jgi:hypothetical protein